MCSSFYDLGLLPAVEESEELLEQRQQQGDLADMFRSSVNRHRPGCSTDHHLYFSQAASNHHPVWSLTSAADDERFECCSLFDNNVVADPFTMTTTTTAEEADHLLPNNNFSSNNTFLSSSPQHLGQSRASSSSMMTIKSTSAGADQSCTYNLHSNSSNSFVKDNNPAAAYASTFVTHGVSSRQQLKPPINCNVISQMFHISSTDDMLPPPSSMVALAAEDDHHITTVCNYNSPGGSDSNSSMSAMLLINEDHNRKCATSGLLRIPSPRNNPATKRSRKSLSKKVVCIPAPAPANSRSSGEVVPSDLWAWRKYGQKPIKGSPYPRGYYRCSSSKGCSARKQVERSRTDPNMLVITYTSEHNHPWPTQRNALAGSTRSHPSKNTCDSSNSSWTCRVVADDRMKRSSSGSDELEPAEKVMIKQQQEHSSGDYEEDEHWRCTYKKKSTYRPRTIELEVCNEQYVQEDDFFAELGEIAGKDHNGFSSFLMDYSPISDKAVI